ncbi:MAG: class I SAM-dependent methyltransferase [Patescibacteria group bacterium]|nr:class I SAM-dependent methyltransferase [Patescibacteria group bacterium]
MTKLNKKFKTNVKLHNCFIEKAELPDNYFNVAYAISVIEHLTQKELITSMRHINRALKPEGYLVVTLDLFPNIYPFTKKKKNRWGRNASVKDIVDVSGMKIVHGDKKELCGYKQFKASYILENLEKYFIGSNYPALIQILILQKKK